MTLLAMRGELETLKSRAQAIIDQYGAGGLTAEKNQELTQLTTKCVELSAQIKAERELDEKKADLGRIDDFLNQPQYKVPQGVGNGESDTAKALRVAGWEVKNGMVCAPTSTGKLYAMYPEQVLFGEIPKNDLDAAQFYKTTRGAMQPSYRLAYTAWLQALAKAHGSESMAYTMLSGEEQKALSEGTDTAGGFLVPPDVQAELLVRKAQMSAIRRAGARVQATSRDILKWPMVQANATSGSIYSSGFVGSVAGETPTFTDVDAAFGSFDVPIIKIRAATKLSNDFIADAVVNILSFLAMNGAQNIALVEDNEFIVGDGSALHPTGITSAPGISTTDLTATAPTTHVFTNDTTHAGPPNALIDLVYSLPPQYVQGAAFLMRRAIEGKVRKLVDGQSRYLWPAQSGSMFADVPRELLGAPIYNSDFMANDGVADNKIIVFGDFSSYIIGERAQITSTVLRERFADTDQTGIILWERVGGAVWNPDGFRFGITHT